MILKANPSIMNILLKKIKHKEDFVLFSNT